MKKLILGLTLAALAVSVQAGEQCAEKKASACSTQVKAACCPSQAQAKAACSGKADKVAKKTPSTAKGVRLLAQR